MIVHPYTDKTEMKGGTTIKLLGPSNAPMEGFRYSDNNPMESIYVALKFQY